MDIWEAKKFTADKCNMEQVLHGSYNKIPLIFLKCGGNRDTGRAQLDSVRGFFDGKPPINGGRIDKVGMGKIYAMLPQPATDIKESTKDLPGLFKLGFAKELVEVMRKLVL
jgi:hypothetical protein